MAWGLVWGLVCCLIASVASNLKEKLTAWFAGWFADWFASHFGRIGQPAPPRIEFNSEGYLPSNSSTSAFNRIMEALKNDGVNMIGVWGMGGVGKTTLVTEVGNKAESLQLFHKVIIATVSRTPSVENIQNKIARELRSKLKTEEKVLIILDDLWDELDLMKIGIPLDGNHKGCKIILTTRRQHVCQLMKSQVTVQLEVMEEDEAWTLFNASLDGASSDSNIIGVAKKVAKECGGLPVAIVTLARALRSRDRNGWEFALRKLQNSKLMDIELVPKDVEKNAYLCLKMSYDNLSREETKRCLLLCALYPEDYSIDVEDFVRHAWALRLYQDADSIEEVRSEVFEAIYILKDSSLLSEDLSLYSKKRSIKMHDVVRDVALWIASKEDNGPVAKSGVESANESSKQKLEILLLDEYGWKTPKEDFEGMPELKVLSLKSLYGFFSLNALKPLTNLRALHLEGFEQLEGISTLAKLTKLEILSLRHCQFEESMDNLGELKNLRVLDMWGCHFWLRYPPSLIQRLVKLEELYLCGSTIKNWVHGAFLLELNSLPRLASLFLDVSSRDFPEGFVFPKLERYNISINKEWRREWNAVSSKLLIISKVLPSNLISNLLRNVEFLEVSGIKEKDIKFLIDTTPGNVSVATILQNLKYVTVDDCKNLEVIFHMKKVENQASLLSDLKDLVLRSLPNLEYVWKMPTQHISLRSLEVVRIKGCGKLKSLLSFSLAQSLECLKKLEIDGCDKLKQIVGESEGDEQEISPVMNPDKPLCLQKLKSLKIYDCPNLEFIFPNFMATEALPQLQKLSLVRLSQLKEICRPAMQKERNGILLPSLTDLTLHKCPELTDAAFQSKPMRASLEDVQLSKLIQTGFFVNANEVSVLELHGCESLEYLVDTTKEHVPNSAFSNLVKLSLRQMGGLKTLCNGQFPKGFLQNLKKLTVSGCDQLQEVFQIDEENQAQLQLLSNLEHLVLERLPELRWILKGPAHFFSLRSLKVVKICNCKRLKSVFSPSLIQSLLQLEELWIENCDELRTLLTELESDGETESNSHLHPLCLPKLTALRIYGCPRLEYVLPITLAQGLPQLEELDIDGREHRSRLAMATESNSNLHSQLKQVFGVAKQHDGVEPRIKLPCLKGLQLYYLTNLSRFGPENYFFEAPALEQLCVCACPQLMKFTIQQEVNSRVDLQVKNYYEGVRLSAFKEFLRNANVDVDLQGLTFLRLEDCEDLECLANTADEEHVPTSDVFTNLVQLRMKNMIGLKVLWKGRPPRGFLQNLKSLRVESCEKLEEIFGIDELLCNTEQNQPPLFSNLDSLKIESAPELRWIVKGPTQYVNLRRLRDVSIYSCNKLESLFSSSLIPSLSPLENLRIDQCDELKTVFTEDETESNTLCMPNLKYLGITDCPTLKYVLAIACAPDLPRLRMLRLIGLTNLSSVTDCPENCFIKAPALYDLKVSGCPRLSNFTFQQHKPRQSKDFEECIDEAELCNNQLRERSPYMICFDQLFLPSTRDNFMSHLAVGDLDWLRYIRKAPTQVVVTHLQSLDIYNCNTLTCVFPAMLARNLRVLCTLKIRCCEKLEQIIVNDDTSASSSQGHDEDEMGAKCKKEMIFPQLQSLFLEELPSLLRFSLVGYHLIFPSLGSLEIRGCSQMITSFTADSIRSQMITSFTADSIQSVHATEAKAPRLDDATPSIRDICWGRDSAEEDASLPPYMEEAKEI